jgi:hypothetical protein
VRPWIAALSSHASIGPQCGEFFSTPVLAVFQFGFKRDQVADACRVRVSKRHDTAICGLARYRKLRTRRVRKRVRKWGASPYRILRTYFFFVFGVRGLFGTIVKNSTRDRGHCEGRSIQAWQVVSGWPRRCRATVPRCGLPALASDRGRKARDGHALGTPARHQLFQAALAEGPRRGGNSSPTTGAIR